MDDNDISKEFDIFEESNRMMIIPRKLHGYTLFKKLQETKSSVVFTILENESLVMKCIPLKHFSIDELNLMLEINHPNIMICCDHFQYPDNYPRFYAIVMPRAREDLLEYTRNRGINVGSNAKLHYLPEPVVCKIINDILKALDYLHQNHIIHRDIKLENILIMGETEKGPNIKVGDLGLARRVMAGKAVNPMVRNRCFGTLIYAAPELLRDDNNSDYNCDFRDEAIYSSNVDIWSLGVSMYILLSGIHPFGYKNNYDYEAYKNGNISFDFPEIIGTESNPFDNVSDLAKDLIRKMLTSEKKDRPSANELLGHPWFSEFDQYLKPTLESAYIQYTNEIGLFAVNETEL